MLVDQSRKNGLTDLNDIWYEGSLYPGLTYRILVVVDCWTQKIRGEIVGRSLFIIKHYEDLTYENWRKKQVSVCNAIDDLNVYKSDSLNEGVADEPGGVGEERHDDDVDVADARRDGIRAVQERDAAQRAHGHGYSWTDRADNVDAVPLFLESIETELEILLSVSRASSVYVYPCMFRFVVYGDETRIRVFFMFITLS